ELSIEDGTEARVQVRGEDVHVTADVPVTVALKDQGPCLDGQPGPGPQAGRRADGSIITASLPSS
ncbi:MAG: hypothetical protein ACR2FL_11095, partial [Nocardioidaceae bacterium]